MPIIKKLAGLISYAFHPLLVLFYMTCLQMVINPYGFGITRIGEGQSNLLIIYVFFQTFLIPMIAISVIEKIGLGFSSGMEDKSSRTVPLIITIILYLWLFVNVNRSSHNPLFFKAVILGCVISLFIAFLINIYMKIDFHTIGMGNLIGMITGLMLQFKYSDFIFENVSYSMYNILFLIIGLSGLVGSAKMVLAVVNPKDLYGGYLVGFTAQLIALQLI